MGDGRDAEIDAAWQRHRAELSRNAKKLADGYEEDIVQSAYLKFVAAVRKNPEALTVAYMHTVVRTTAMDHHRKAKRFGDAMDPHRALEINAERLVTTDPDQITDVGVCLESLAVEDRKLLLLFGELGSRAKVATYLGRPEETVRTEINRALERLERCITKTKNS